MRVLIVLSLTLILAGIGFGQTIDGSAHDFATETWNNTGEICVVCHTPHHSDITVTDAPLWNHEVTATTFQPYSSTSLDAMVGQPDGSSKLCLSCHDGTVAVDNFGGRTGGGEFVTGNELIGTDLRNDHPISFTYNTTLSDDDGGLHDPATTDSGLGGTITEDMLAGDKMQCASCHDVHNGSGLANLLVKSNTGSELCLTCHNK